VTQIASGGGVYVYNTSVVTQSQDNPISDVAPYGVPTVYCPDSTPVYAACIWLSLNLPAGQDSDTNHYDDYVLCTNVVGGVRPPNWNLAAPTGNKIGKKFLGYFDKDGKQIYKPGSNDEAVLVDPATVTLTNGQKLYAHWGDVVSGLTIDGKDISELSGTGWSYADHVLKFSSETTHSISGNAAITNDVRIKVDVNEMTLKLSGVNLQTTGGSPIFFGSKAWRCTIVVGGESSFESRASGCPGIDIGGRELTLKGDMKLTVKGGSGASAIGLKQGATASTSCNLTVDGAYLEAHGGAGAYDLGIGAENAPSVITKVTVKSGTVIADKIGGGGAGSFVKILNASVINSEGAAPTVVVPSPVNDRGAALYPVLLQTSLECQPVAARVYPRRYAASRFDVSCYSVAGACCLWLPDDFYQIDANTDELSGKCKFQWFLGVEEGLTLYCPKPTPFSEETLMVNDQATKDRSSGPGWRVMSDDPYSLVLDKVGADFTLKGSTLRPIDIRNASSVTFKDALCGSLIVHTNTTLKLDGRVILQNTHCDGIELNAGADLQIVNANSGSSSEPMLLIFSNSYGIGTDSGTDPKDGRHRLTVAGGRVCVHGGETSVDIGHPEKVNGNSARELELVMKGGLLKAKTARVNPLTVLGGALNVKNVYTSPKNATFATLAAAQQMALQTAVERPSEVAEANVDATEYAQLFTVKAVENKAMASGASGDADASGSSGSSGESWTLQADLKDEVKAEVQEAIDAAGTSLAESLASETPSATVQTKAGLYYGIAGAADLQALDSAEPQTWTLGDGTAKTLESEKPAADRGFYRVIVKP